MISAVTLTRNGKIVLAVTAAVLVLLVTGCGGSKNAAHYTKAKTDTCLSKLGVLADPAHYFTPYPGGGSAVALRGNDRGKVIEIGYLRTAQAAKERITGGWPPGMVEAKGNAIVWVHQTIPGMAEVSDGDLRAAEKCLA